MLSLRLASFLSMLCCSQTLVAQGFYPAGSENKAKGMESALASRRGSAVLYNPANVALSPEGQHPYAEIGLASLNYSYEHPDREMVIVSTTTPTLTLGYTQRLSDRLYAGATFFPEKFGSSTTPAMPQEVGGQISNVEFRNQHRKLHSGLALAYRVDKQLQFGVSVLHTYDNQRIGAQIEGEEPGSLVNSEVSGQYVRPRFGSHFSQGKLQGVLTYMPEQRVTYAGRTITAFGVADEGDTVARFEPSVIAAGVGLRVQKISAQADLNYRQWSKGRHFIQGNEPGAPALQDVLERGISAAYRLDRRLKLTAGIALVPSPWGTGMSGDSLETQTVGLNLQNYTAFERRNVGAGASYDLDQNKRQQIDVAFYHSQGAREIGREFDNPGYYQLDLNVLSTTFTANF